MSTLVPLFDTQALQEPRCFCHPFFQFRVGRFLYGVGYRAVVNDCGLIASAPKHMTVHGIEARVEHCSREPFKEGGIRLIQHAVPFLVPIDFLGSSSPESFRVLQGLSKSLFVSHQSPPECL